MSAVYNFAYKK